MFALPGIIALLLFLWVRPQELLPALQSVPVLHLLLLLAVFGYVIDLRLRVIRPAIAPQLGLVIVFALWAVITVVVKAPANAMAELLTIFIPVTAFVVISQSIQTFRALELIAGVLLALALFLSVIGIHQGQANWGCVVIDPDGVGDSHMMAADGRPCSDREHCYQLDAEPGKDYLCERVGLLGTNSVGGGRVRYRGILQDPNELALTIVIALPFAFAFVARRARSSGTVLAVISFTVILVCTMLTKSRGGQLVFLAAIGVYGIRRWGLRGIIAGAVLAMPVLLLGGRSGGGATQSSLERLEAWNAGFEMLRVSPALGAGFGQFTEHHYLNAHNAYVLALAELGPFGLLLWTSILYLSIKIVVLGYLRALRDPDAGVARDWGLALIASFAGALAGIFFLSFAYHPVMWVYFGLAAAYYACIRTHDPSWRVRFGFLDIVLIAIVDIALVAALFVYLKLNPV